MEHLLENQKRAGGVFSQRPAQIQRRERMTARLVFRPSFGCRTTQSQQSFREMAHGERLLEKGARLFGVSRHFINAAESDKCLPGNRSPKNSGCFLGLGAVAQQKIKPDSGEQKIRIAA